MPITVTNYPTPDQVTQRALDFFRRHLVLNGIDPAAAKAAVAKGGDRWMVASAFSANLAVVHANARLLEDATMADTATGDDLTRLCTIRGIARSVGGGAQGNVVVTTSGTVSYSAGQELVSNDTGKRYQVISPATVTNGASVAVVGIDTGLSTILPPGSVLTWTSPPAGSATTCAADASGLTNGQDPDTDGSLRAKLLQSLQQPQNGGSWSHYRAWAQSASAGVQGAYVYPAAQGPSTTHLAFTIPGTRANNYERVGNSALVTLVTNAVVAQQPEQTDVTVTAVQDQDLTVAFRLTIPNPTVEGGPGGGWLDASAVRWPLFTAAAPTTVVTVVSPTVFVISSTSSLPSIGLSLSFFDSTNRVFLLAKVASFTSTGAGPYVATLTLDRALPSILVGDYLCPAAVNIEAYAENYMASVALLAPGEKTSDTVVLPRAYRHPKSSAGYPSAVTTTQLTGLQTSFPEVSNASYLTINDTAGFTLPLEPALPGSVRQGPFVWRVRRLAFYP